MGVFNTLSRVSESTVPSDMVVEDDSNVGILTPTVKTDLEIKSIND